MITCCIGIMAYNEESNIGSLLEALRKQRLSRVFIDKIVVVASGCTDRTEEIVRRFCVKDRGIKLLTEEKRQGKAVAISLFLKTVKNYRHICVLESADTLPLKNTVEKLVAPFSNPKIGMTGTHPIPVNQPDKFMGFVVHLLWELHHRIALRVPKMGEMIAFRNVVREIPGDTAVDEVSIETIVSQKGYKLHYVPEAVIRNRGPQTISDFLKQRRRIYAGHLWVKKTQQYVPSTMSSLGVIKALSRDIKFSSKSLFWTVGAISLEGVARLLGTYDFHIKKRNPYKWDIAKTTKEIVKLARNNA